MYVLTVCIGFHSDNAHEFLQSVQIYLKFGMTPCQPPAPEYAGVCAIIGLGAALSGASWAGANPVSSA